MPAGMTRLLVVRELLLSQAGEVSEVGDAGIFRVRRRDRPALGQTTTHAPGSDSSATVTLADSSCACARGRRRRARPSLLGKQDRGREEGDRDEVRKERARHRKRRRHRRGAFEVLATSPSTPTGPIAVAGCIPTIARAVVAMTSRGDFNPIPIARAAEYRAPLEGDRDANLAIHPDLRAHLELRTIALYDDG